MFIFNTEFLLLKLDNGSWINIKDFWLIGYIFLTALLSMLIFCVITQRFCLTQIKWYQTYEYALLGVSCIIFAWPEYLMRNFMFISRTWWNLAAIGLLLLFVLSQLLWKSLRSDSSKPGDWLRMHFPPV